MKRLKVMAALLVILSLVFLCVACGNKTVDSAGEDGTPDATQQDTATDDKTSADDKTSTGGKTQKENTTPVEGGVVTEGPLEITGGVIDSPFEDGNTSADDKPTDNKPADTKPDTKTDTPDASQDLKWEEYYALTPEQQDAYFDSFSDYKEFQKWMKKAQEQFKEEHPTIEIGPDGSIDLSKLK